jgi:hypothetical protein
VCSPACVAPSESDPRAGAAATVNTLNVIAASSAMFARIRAVVLMGDPRHRPGMHANVDQDGGHTNDGAMGWESSGAGIPAWWDNSGKVMDICYVVRRRQGGAAARSRSVQGDGVCSGTSITPEHTEYEYNNYTQTMGSKFMVEKLK